MRPYDIEPEDLFDRETSEKMRAEAAVRRQEQEAALAEDKKRRDELFANGQRALGEAGRILCARQYALAGVEPTKLDRDGYPTVSLSVLFSIGWSIREVDGKKVLVRPFLQRESPKDEIKFGD